MRALLFGTAAVLATSCSALAESRWLESRLLEVSERKVLCDRANGVRLLARMQMIASGSDRWRKLSRQQLVVESIAMGALPLDPDRCYVIARVGLADEKERRAFEVRDFFDSAEQTSIFTLGQAYDQPSGEGASDK